MVIRTWIVALAFLPLASFSNEPPAKIIKIYSARSDAFVGLKDNGSIEVWGNANKGGTLPESASSALSGQRVTEIYPGNCAFAALTNGGKVVTWGGSNCGGDSSSVSTTLASGVTKVYANRRSLAVYPDRNAFAALKSDGSVVTWGYSNYGGDSSGVADQLSSGVTKIVSSIDGFAALKSDHSVVYWGSHGANNFTTSIGDSVLRMRDVSLLLESDVVNIFASDSAFVALKRDGRLFGWGWGVGADTLGISHNMEYAQNKVVNVFSNQNSFAALRDNGSVVTWGDWDAGGNSFAVRNRLLTGVTKVFSTQDSFAALKNDGTVVSWGGFGIDDNGNTWEYGWVNVDGDEVKTRLRVSTINLPNVRVSNIVSTGYAFAALRSNGTVVTWGERNSGADTSAATSAIGTGSVTSISATNFGAFAALKSDGSVATWGLTYAGGDSSAVASDLSSNVIQVVGGSWSFSALKSDGSTVTW